MATLETSRKRADAELMKLVQCDDVGAFGVLYDRYADRMLSLAARICGRDAAEDVTQVAFVSVWRHRDRYSPEQGSVSGWLFMYTRRRAIDAARRETSRDDHVVAGTDKADRALGSAVASDVTDGLAAARDESERLIQQLQRVPPAQRRVIELAYFGGLTHREIAERLELPVGTVKGRMRLGLEKLRAALDAAEPGLASAGPASPPGAGSSDERAHGGPPIDGRS